jgi:16S rRNA pseudouridine516 synthase
MFKAIGSEVVKLHRKAIGGLVLDETLESGEYRELSENELEKIFAME